MGLWSKLFGGKRQDAVSPRRASEEVFIELYVAEARRHPRVERVERVGGRDMAVRIWMTGSDAHSEAFLKNTFLETRDASPEDKLTAIRRLLGILDTPGDDLSWEEAGERLVPLLRASSFPGSAAQVAQPFAPFLRVIVGVDHEATISYLSQEKLSRWCQPVETVIERANLNLQAHVDAASRETPDVERYDEAAPHPIWHVTRDDAYESSRLALPGFLASFRGRVAGTPIAIVPHRRLLIVSGDEHPAAIARLVKMAESEFNASPRPLSPALYEATPRSRCSRPGASCGSSPPTASGRSRTTIRHAFASWPGPQQRH